MLAIASFVAIASLALFRRAWRRYATQLPIRMHGKQDAICSAQSTQSDCQEEIEIPRPGIVGDANETADGRSPPATGPAQCRSPAVGTSRPAALERSEEAVAEDSTDALCQRVGFILDQLRPTLAGSETRRRLVVELKATLGRAAEGAKRTQRAVARAFVDHCGPEIVYEMESSMSGNWVLDAKNGTMQNLSSIRRLPGPIGQAVAVYTHNAERNKLDAAELKCSHPRGAHR